MPDQLAQCGDYEEDERDNGRDNNRHAYLDPHNSAPEFRGQFPVLVAIDGRVGNGRVVRGLCLLL